MPVYDKKLFVCPVSGEQILTDGEVPLGWAVVGNDYISPKGRYVRATRYVADVSLVDDDLAKPATDTEKADADAKFKNKKARGPRS